VLCARRRAPSLAGLRVGVGGAGRLHHRARIIERRFDSRLSPQGLSRIEMRSIAQAQGALKELARLLPDAAARIVAGSRSFLRFAACRFWAQRWNLGCCTAPPADSPLEPGTTGLTVIGTFFRLTKNQLEEVGIRGKV